MREGVLITTGGSAAGKISFIDICVYVYSMHSIKNAPNHPDFRTHRSSAGEGVHPAGAILPFGFCLRQKETMVRNVETTLLHLLHINERRGNTTAA